MRRTVKILSLVATVLWIAMATPTVAEDVRGEFRVATGSTFGAILDGVAPEGELREPRLPGSRLELVVVEGSLSIIEHDGYLSVVGEVRNDDDRIAGALRLEAAGVDETGSLVATGSGRIYGAAPAVISPGVPWDIVVPGATAVFIATLSNPGSAIETVLVRATGIASDVTLGWFPLVRAADWEVSEAPFGVLLHTVVRNDGPDDMVGLNATVVLRNLDGAVIGAARAYPDADRIGGYLGGIRAGQEAQVFMALPLDRDTVDAADLEDRFAGRFFTGGRFDYAVIGVAHSPGAGGAVWRSSLGLTNLSGAPGRVRLTYRAGGGSWSTDLDLADGESVLTDDVVGAFPGVPDRSAGYLQIGSDVPLTVGGRTANQAPAGGFGQVLPVVTPAETFENSVSVAPVVLSPLRGGERFRSNIGLVNLSGRHCDARVEIFDAGGTPITDFGWRELGATEWLQLNDVMPDGVERATASVDVEFGCPVTVYASVIEKATGDPTTVFPDRQTEIAFGGWEPDPRGGFVVIPWADQEPPEPAGP
jgi:hypothetical protein